MQHLDQEGLIQLHMIAMSGQGSTAPVSWAYKVADGAA